MCSLLSAKGEDAWEESWDGTQDIDIEGKVLFVEIGL
jgi:hypothetical protein